MMDSLHLYDEPIHVTDSEMKRDYSGEAKSPRSRTIRPVKYYHIDFGNARVYLLNKARLANIVDPRGTVGI